MPEDRLSLTGLVAATFTPLHRDGSLNTTAIPGIVEHLLRHNIAGLYILGSTGEGPSLTFKERCTVAEAFVKAAAGRVATIIQVGGESLVQARQLAAHAQQIGASAISAVSPVYFKPDSVNTLVDSMAEIAAGAPALPFYYYHIPAATGLPENMLEFLRLGGERIPTLRGIKFTSPNVHEFQACLEFADRRYEFLWGLDENLLSGLAAGAKAAVGSTYNFCAPVYQRIRAAFASGDLDEARRQQSRSQLLVRTFVPYGHRAAQKAIMALIDQHCGPTRLPVVPLGDTESAALRKDLEAIGFFDWLEEPTV